MIATSPRMRTLTSSAVRPLIVTGRAVCARNCFLSTSDPSGFEHRKSSGQDLVEALHIAVLHRMDVVAVERGQRIKVALGRSVCLHGTSQKNRPKKSLTEKLLAHEDAVVSGLGAASGLLITD